MAKQTIGLGTAPNDDTGDPARTAFDKINDNFDELYAGSGSIAPLVIEDANTIALRNGTNAQTLQVYGSINGADYNRGFMRWAATALEIGGEIGGAGSANFVDIIHKAQAKIRVGNGTVSVGPMFGIAGAFSDVGASNSIWFWSPADGILRITNDSQNGLTRLVLGVNTTSWPALQPSGAGLKVVLGDGSANTWLEATAYRTSADNINAQTGTTYTILATDNGKTITCNNGAPITVTVPASLGAAFSCNIVQIGAGQVTFAASGVTLNSYNSLVKLAGQYAAASLLANAANVFNLAGNLSA